VRGQLLSGTGFFLPSAQDLNFENPRVQDAMIQVLKFWLDPRYRRLSGSTRCPTCTSVRAPTCENLKETHEYLKRIRTEIDAAYPGTACLLAEAKPVARRRGGVTFGDEETGGNECHMAFHFPADAPHLHGRPAGSSANPISEIPGPRRLKIPGRLPVGASSCATTTSSTLENGHRRRARLHVQGVRPRTPRMKANIGIRRRLATLPRQRPQPA